MPKVSFDGKGCGTQEEVSLGRLTSFDVSSGFPKLYFNSRSQLKMLEEAQVGSAMVKKGSSLD